MSAARSTAEAGETRRHAMRMVIATAAIAGLGGLLFGYDTGVIASALLFIEPDFGLSSFGSGLVVAAVPIGAVVGAAFAGRLSDQYGRRMLIIGSAVVFIVGSLASAAANVEAVLVVARVIIGIAIGLASATAPVYISEVSPPDIRGRLVTFFQLAVTIGIVVAYAVGLIFDSSGDWRAMLALGAVPARLPADRDAEDAAEPALAGHGRARLRGEGGPGDDPRGRSGADRRRARRDRREHRRGAGRLEGPLHPVVRAALVVGVGLAILQQVSGINTVIYFAPTIIGYTGVDSSSAAILASVAVGVVNVGMTLVAIRLLDRAGRRPLLLWGSALMAVALSILALVFILGAGSTVGSLVAIGSLMMYVGAFAIGLGPIFWLMNSEIYPLRVRSKAAAVGTMANWFFNFLVSLTFLLLIDGARQQRRLLLLRGGLRADVLLLPAPGTGDEGQAPRGHPGDLPRAGRGSYLVLAARS